MQTEMESIALFATGGGSNAREIMRYFERHGSVRVGLVVSNRADCGALVEARERGIDTLIVDRENFYYRGHSLILHHLAERKITLLVLAGFLWLVPEYLLNAFPRRILNIHPALLPAYGGKGMYGHQVHAAVKRAGDRESGMTVHVVDERYDSGEIIFQARCEIGADDTVEDIGRKVLLLEHRHYAPVIERYLEELRR